MVNYARSNTYVDASGNQVKGKYIYPRPHGKFQAMLKYPEGYSKSKMCYDMEEAVAFVEGQWETYAAGWYYNENGDKIFLRRPGDERPPREF